MQLYAEIGSNFMTIKPEAEAIFESFCHNHGLLWERVPTGKTRTPDYIVSINDKTLYFEIKQIDKDENFKNTHGVCSRTIGSHIRQKIFDSRKQIQVGAKVGAPSILVVYNNIDPMQHFGTEQQDFIAAMYGEMTVKLKDGRIVESYHGRNSLLRESHNSSFSAVGHLRHSASGTTIRLYENAFASNPLPVSLLPPCFEVINVEVTYLGT